MKSNFRYSRSFIRHVFQSLLRGAISLMYFLQTQFISTTFYGNHKAANVKLSFLIKENKLRNIACVKNGVEFIKFPTFIYLERIIFFGIKFSANSENILLIIFLQSFQINCILKCCFVEYICLF